MRIELKGGESVMSEAEFLSSMYSCQHRNFSVSFYTFNSISHHSVAFTCTVCILVGKYIE